MWPGSVVAAGRVVVVVAVVGKAVVEQRMETVVVVKSVQIAGFGIQQDRFPVGHFGSFRWGILLPGLRFVGRIVWKAVLRMGTVWRMFVVEAVEVVEAVVVFDRKGWTVCWTGWTRWGRARKKCLEKRKRKIIFSFFEYDLEMWETNRLTLTLSLSLSLSLSFYLKWILFYFCQCVMLSFFNCFAFLMLSFLHFISLISIFIQMSDTSLIVLIQGHLMIKSAKWKMQASMTFFHLIFFYYKRALCAFLHILYAHYTFKLLK